MADLVVLDPGHGDHDPGAIGNGLQEKERALTLTRMVRDILVANGVNVKMTRDSDIFVTLSGRAKIANDLGAKIFVSFHLNSGGGTGYESFVYNRNDKNTNRLQDLIHAEAMKVLGPKGFRDRGKKTKDLAVVRETHMPAVLTENGFIDNANDMSHIRQDEVLRQLAKGYAKAILNYLGKDLVNGGGSGGNGGGSTKPPVSNDGIGVATVAVDNLRLRRGPGTTYEHIRYLPKGEPYIVYAIKDGWVNLGGDQWAYAGDGYMKLAINNNASYSSGGILGTATVEIASLNLRKGPGNGYEVIRALKKGEPYIVYAFKDGWFNLGGDQWAYGGDGYMSFKI